MDALKLVKGNPEPLFVNYYKKDGKDDRVLVFVGGSGDDRNKFENLVALLHERGLSYGIVTFSFRGIETGKEFPTGQQYYDLRELVEYLVSKKHKKKISIVCTSMGAISTTLIAVDKQFNRYLHKIIFLDPADYPKIGKKEPESKTWAGTDKFESKRAVLSNKIKNINSNVKVDVVNFLLRNFGKSGYAPVGQRGGDNPKLYSRLNNDMVKAFYKNTPAKNKGKYVEDRKLPHAFLRDGNVKANEIGASELIYRLLN